MICLYIMFLKVVKAIIMFLKVVKDCRLSKLMASAIMLLMLLWTLAMFMVPANSQDKNIFLLAGQSNMAGLGGVVKNKWDGVVPTECKPNPRILRLNPGLKWEEAIEPLHKGIDVNVTNGIGPGFVFANSLLKKYTSDNSLLIYPVIGLVPCAVSGSKISDWARGTSLYDQLVRRAEVALQGGGTIQALLWYQGESDTVRRSDADTYKGRLEEFINDLRADLQMPALLVIQVALASGGKHYTEIVREAQMGTHELANVRCVNAKGLPLEPDHLHLTTPAQVRLGQMLADSFLMSSSSK